MWWALIGVDSYWLLRTKLVRPGLLGNTHWVLMLGVQSDGVNYNGRKPEIGKIIISTMTMQIYVNTNCFPSTFSNSYIHWKLLVGWMILILLDSLANFRFEYLYPLIMFFRSIYDSYKYQGLVSVLHTLSLSLSASLLIQSFIHKCTHVLYIILYLNRYFAYSLCVWLHIWTCSAGVC